MINTMNEIDKITAVIFASIDEINESLPAGKKISKSLETSLVGPGSALDSLGLILLIVAIERKYSDAFGKRISLSDQLMMSVEHNPLKTLATLQDHILKFTT